MRFIISKISVPKNCLIRLRNLLPVSFTNDGIKMASLLLYCLNITYEVLPLRVQVGLVGQAALHNVGAVVGAGLDRGQATTVRAVNQLHQGLRAV